MYYVRRSLSKEKRKKITNFTEIGERQSPAGATFKFSLVTRVLCH